MDYLSNTELYYSKPENFTEGEIILSEDDFYHVTKVMRHNVGDIIFVTDGLGRIIKCEISEIRKDNLLLSQIDFIRYKNKFENIFFCLPRLKNSDRFEFALEKCIEIGITNFIVYDAERQVSKGNKIDRWNKIALAAMKQSLRSYLPQITLAGKLNEIKKFDGEKYIFEQNSEYEFKSANLNLSEKSFLVFGPEGGLSEKELRLFDQNEIYKLTANRLRSETAIIVCAALL